MNKKILTGLLIATGFLLNACQKDLDIFVPDAGQLNGPDTAWYSTITASMPVSALKNSLAIPSYIDSFQVNNSNAYITTPFGLQCGFPPNCCVDSAGLAVTGTVQVEMQLLKKKGDMIMMNRPTTSNGRLLVSGGEVFIRLKKEQQELRLAPGVTIAVRYPVDLPLNTQMRLFLGDESNTERFNWQSNTDPVNNTLTMNTQNYELQTNHLRWISSDYYFDTLNAQHITLAVDCAAYFTNANSTAFTVLRDSRSVAGMYGDVSNRAFTAGGLPCGKAITVVVISKQGNDYFMGYINTVTDSPTTGTTTTQHVLVKPVIRSLQEIISFLNTL